MAVEQKGAYNILQNGAKEQVRVFSSEGGHLKDLKGSSAAEEDWQGQEPHKGLLGCALIVRWCGRTLLDVPRLGHTKIEIAGFGVVLSSLERPQEESRCYPKD